METTKLTPAYFLVINYDLFVANYKDILVHVAKASVEPDGKTWVTADIDLTKAKRMVGDKNIFQKDISATIGIAAVPEEPIDAYWF